MAEYLKIQHLDCPEHVEREIRTALKLINVAMVENPGQFVLKWDVVPEGSNVYQMNPLTWILEGPEPVKSRVYKSEFKRQRRQHNA